MCLEGYLRVGFAYICERLDNNFVYTFVDWYKRGHPPFPYMVQ